MKEPGRKAIRNMIKVISLVFALPILLLSAISADAQFLYVHDDNGPCRIFGFRVGASGTLTPVPGSPFSTGGFGGVDFDVGSVNVVAVNSLLYSTNRFSNSVSGFRINADGSLTSVPGSPFLLNPGGAPIGVAASSDGQFLYVGRGFTFGIGTGIDAFSIAPNGALTLVAGSPFGLGFGGNGFDVIFDPLRNNVITNQNSDRVGVFHVVGGGALSQIAGSPFFTPTGNNHKMALTPNGSQLFVAGGGDSNASALNVAVDGSLSNAPGSPIFIPATVIGTAVHPSGNFVYFGLGFFGPNNNIRGFNVSGLTPIPGEPFASGEFGPTGLTTDNLGNFLFAANSNSVSVLSIAVNGALTPISGSPFPIPTNGVPTGIVFFEPTPPPTFDLCLQDDSSGAFIRINSNTGEYLVNNCQGFTIGGTGAITKQGGITTLQHFASDRRVVARVDSRVRAGTATIQLLSPAKKFTIMDSNTANDTCACTTP